MRHILVRCVRILGAILQAAAWLTLTASIITLFALAAVCILARIAFNTPMIVWRAANTKAPHQ